MQKIRLLQITNFQSHEDTTMELSPGVNIILGASDVGKSSIIRALNWVSQNKPRGTGFIRDTKDGLTASVGVEMADDMFVLRTRGNKKNEYECGNEDESEILKALNTEVPEAVSDILGISEINIQPQSESYFLLTDSAGQVAKKLNEVSNLKEIDDSLSNINSKIRAQNSTIAAQKSTVENLETEISGFSWLEEAKKKMKTIVALEASIKTHAEKKNKLSELLQYVSSIEESIKKLPPEHALEELMDVRQQYEDRETHSRKTVSLAKIVDTVFSISDELKQYERLTECPDLLSDEIPNDYKQTQARCDRVFDVLDALEEINSSLDYSNKSVKVATKKLMDLMEEADGQICPKCNQPIKFKEGV